MELSSKALTTLETVKDHIGIDAADTTWDNRIKFLINGFSEFIESYAGRGLAKGTFTQKLDSYGHGKIYLRTWPILSITSIKIDNVLVSAGDYLPYNEQGSILYRSGGWPDGDQNIEVIYSGGYVLPKDADDDNPRTLPYDIELACVKGVGNLLNKSDAEGVRSSNSGGMSVNFADGLDSEVKGILDSYKVLNV